MFSKLSNSWALVKASARVLQADKELMIFPMVSGLALLLVSVSFFMPTFYFVLPAKEAGQIPELVLYLVGFLFYVVQYFIMIFFNTALVGAALIRLDGGNPTVSDGLSIAAERIPVILGYAVIAATVGMILRALRERAGFLVGLISVLGGLAWTLATYLVVPVLAARNVGPFEAIRESTALLKKTWGEQLAGGAGMGLAFGLMSLGLILSVGLLMSVGIALESTAVLILAGASAVLGLLALGLISATLGGIYSAALYRYAQSGTVSFFDEQALRGAFHAK
jgi:hypothetical protein